MTSARRRVRKHLAWFAGVVPASPLIWPTLAAVMILGFGLIGVGIYLQHRADATQDEFRRLQRSVCGAFRAIPAAPQFAEARRLAAQPGRPRECAYVPTVHPRSRSGRVPRVSVTVIVTPDAPASPVVSVRRRPLPPEAPHRAPEGRPTGQPTPRPRPSPTPTPTPTCLLGLRRPCL